MSNQKQLIAEIMSEDAKNGLYKQQTVVEYLIEQLQVPCKGIPSHIVEQAKQMEKSQIKDAWESGWKDHDNVRSASEKYYIEKYGKDI